MDLIDRQAAIDEIEERKNANGYRNVAVISELNRLEGYIMRLPSAQPERIECADYDHKTKSCPYYCEVTRKTAHELQIEASCKLPERRTGHWIPCSERLPELDEDGYSDKVLVCFSNFTGCEVCEYRECDDCHGWYVGDSDDNPEDVGVHVIAWQPLPEPYREGES